jgi:hypothetical protein
MTLLATAPPTTARPVPWHRLTWAVWRRYRPTLLGTAAVVAAVSVYLVITGHQTRAAYAEVAGCQPPVHSPTCQFRWTSFVEAHGQSGFIGPLLLLLPGLVGAFVGASLLGRELETGVYRYSWTQGVGRMRWAVAMILPGAIAVPAVMGALGLLVRWRSEPLVDNGVQHRLDPSFFPTSGPAIAGWTLVAFSGGVLAGLLWRRTVPAIASSFAAWFGLAYLASVLRLRQPAPVITSADPDPHDLIIDTWWTKGGARVTEAQINSTLEALGVRMNTEGNFQATPGSAQTDPLQYLAQHGYTQVHSVQPDSRYWTFQWIEFGWLLALSVVLLGITFWWLRRRSA